jgi:hypothetical protein
MKRLLLASGFILAEAASCCAKQPTWRGVDQSTQVVMYVDTSNVVRNGNDVSVWALIDLKAPNEKYNWLSSVSQFTLDCVSSMSTTRTVLEYSGHMGHGDIVRSVTADFRAEPIVPGSILDSLKDQVCGR